jgi:hypothetical protein
MSYFFSLLFTYSFSFITSLRFAFFSVLTSWIPSLWRIISFLFSHFLPSYLRKLPRLVGGPILLACIFVTSLYWFLLTLTSVLISALVPLFIILLVCIAPFFRRCVVFLPFLRNQLFSNVLSRRMRDQILWPPTLPHGHVASLFLFLCWTYSLSFHQIIQILSFII